MPGWLDGGSSSSRNSLQLDDVVSAVLGHQGVLLAHLAEEEELVIPMLHTRQPLLQTLRRLFSVEIRGGRALLYLLLAHEKVIAEATAQQLERYVERVPTAQSVEDVFGK